MRLKWKTKFSKWSIVVKYAIKFELTIKRHKCCVGYYVRAAPWVVLSGFIPYGLSSVSGLSL
jgi:hypothetical protein